MKVVIGRFCNGPGWLLTLSAYLTIVSAALLFLTYLVKPLKGVVGLVERGIYLGAQLWLALVLLFALL